MDLRGYQTEALDRIAAAADRGVRRQLGVAATGLGKTIIFCALAERMACRTLVVAHRDELIEQAAAKVREVWPGVDVGIVKGDADGIHATVVVASVQTLSRPKRLARLLAPSVLDCAPQFGLVVIDEAHHSAAKSYRDLMHALRCDEPDGPLLLGVTATPDRGDGKGLDDLFDEITFSYDIRWGIAQQWLSDLRGKRVQLAADFGSLKVTAGDYNQGQAGAMLEDAGAPDAIVRAWLKLAPGRRTLVFTPTVALAQMVADEFASAGVRAGCVSGATPIEVRRGILAAYSTGALDVVVNCMVLTEGYDEPRTDCIIVARPTKSRALYTQMVGRGTRVHPEKMDCLVIDVVGVTDVHDLVTVPSLFGIERPEKVWDDQGDATVMGVLRDQVEEHERAGRLLATEARLFDKVREHGKMAWVPVHQPGHLHRYELGLGRRQAPDGTDAVLERLVLVEIERPDGRRTYRAGHQSGTVKRVLMDDVSLELAQGVAEDLVRKMGATGLASTDAPWRKKRPTRKQRDLAEKMHIDVPVGCTAGELSELIDAKMAARRNRKPATAT